VIELFVLVEIRKYEAVLVIRMKKAEKASVSLNFKDKSELVPNQ
jgi:hypothetical protein